ncbi:hypothetical protein I4U23_028821 [Adineta vaga]|nr:hypothetical protein I4U23_028821 [Adineta vaga]
MDLPMIIVEFGQQRQRLKLKKHIFTINELLELFSKTFQKVFDLKQYEILLSNQRIDSTKIFNFHQLDNFQRFKIQLNSKTSTKIDSDENDLISVKQRLNIASKNLNEVAVLIKSIRNNYQNLIQMLNNEDNVSFHVNLSNEHLLIPPGFKSLSRESSSPDEGIDRDTESVSTFESAYSSHRFESVYLECREDNTIINEPNSILTKNSNSKLEWRCQPYRSRPYVNRNKVKYQWNYNKDQSNNKPCVKKPVNPNKAPLPLEKKKNIPCKYAAGGNCKRGSQCRFIHVV